MISQGPRSEAIFERFRSIDELQSQVDFTIKFPKCNLRILKNVLWNGPYTIRSLSGAFDIALYSSQQQWASWTGFILE